MTPIRDCDILIVGTGFSRPIMAIEARKRGFRDIVILEKAQDVGGTWRENTYPGVACDEPSHLYSMASHPNPDWNTVYAGGRRIWAYMRKVARDDGLYELCEFRQTLASARWSGQHWQVETEEGQSWRARVLVSGIGALHIPLMPEIPGTDSLPQPGVPFGPVETRSGSCRQADRGGGHRRFGGAVRTRGCQDRRAGHDSPAHRALCAAAPRRACQTLASPAVSSAAPDAQDPPCGVFPHFRTVACGFHRSPPGSGFRHEDVTQGAGAVDHRSRAAGRADTALPDWLQTDLEFERLVSGVGPGQCRGRMAQAGIEDYRPVSAA